MTEIHVQPKKRSIWPWALGLAVALLLLWVVVDRNTGREELATGDVAPGTAAPDATRPVWVESERFIVFVRQPADFGDMNGAHEYTRTGLRYLASALDEVNRQGGASAPDVSPTIAALRVAAEELSEGAAAPEHARAAAPVFRQAAEAMTTVQRAHHADAADEVNAAREAAQGVSADRPLQEQADAVRAFFDRAVAALQAMGAPAPQAR